MTRSESKLAGLKHYEGSPCSKCGNRVRYCSSCKCVVCAKAEGRTPEHRAATRKWYAGHSEQHKVLRDDWRADNRPQVRAWNAEYRKSHLSTYSAHTMAYNARKKQALPVWADLEEIKKIYAACPPGHQVDHVIPLRGRLVSGLHVAENLQYLPGVENNEKGNSYAAA